MCGVNSIKNNFNAQIITLPRFAQTSTSANIWSIVAPTLITSTNSTQRVIDMGLALVAKAKDSVVQAVVLNTTRFPLRIDSLRFVGANAAE
ncbi:MAG: hypothetical protein EAZ92_16370 [Candidatus Kapaibacterium sp.]|nr:MAG: hypothetical protein EAZ92_16370 [Candidatus Kapabacteria bacterium]